LSWSAPSNGGLPITGYVVTPSVNGVAQTAIETGSAATSFTVTGLTNGTAYQFTVSARNVVGLGGASSRSAAVTPLGDLVAVTPKRIFDTRPGESPDALRDVPKTPVVPAAPLQVRFGDLPGLTPPTGIGAVSLNVAVTNPATAGFITVYPCGERKLVASVNFVAGQTVSNAVIAPVSADGDVCFFSSTPADLIVDLNSWFPSGSGYTAVGPDRVLDTRPGESPEALRAVPKVQVTPEAPLEVQVGALPGGITPADGVGAVSLNVAVTNPAAAGFVTVFPCADRRLVASVNYSAGQTVSNAVIAPVSPSGRICFFSSSPTDLIVDINGWFPSGSGFTGVGPERVFDTRPGESPDALRSVPKTRVAPAVPLEVQFTDMAGIIPAGGVGAVSLNVAVTDPEAAGFITVFPCGTRELIASVNYTAGQTVSNAVIAPVSPAGKVCFFSSSSTDLIVDVNGWFAS
jgi:Fibronectin type III domain